MLQLNFIPFPELRTERLLLREIRLSDVEEIFILRSNPETQKYIHRPPAAALDEAREFIERITLAQERGESISWALVKLGEEKLIGSICLWNIDAEQEMGEVGYSLLPDHFGKGYMSEALQPVTQFGFNTMKLKRIDAFTDKNNIASLKLLEKHAYKRNIAFEEIFEDKEELEYNVIYTRLAP